MENNSRKGPSVNQALNRMFEGHARMLRCVAENQSFLGPGFTQGDYRGAKTIRATLVKWGAVSEDKLTAFGCELLAAWDHENGQ